MKAKKVLDILGITRKTLNNYVRTKKIRVVQLENGFYEYNDADVNSLSHEKIRKRRIVVFEPNHSIEITPDLKGYDDLVDYILRFVKL